MQRYMTLSIELHLFFARIMKEHAIFLEAGFPGKEKNYAEEAEWYKNQFEKVLKDVLSISEGAVRPEVLASGEIVTEYTINTETKTEELSGIAINKDITLMEYNLRQGINNGRQVSTDDTVRLINKHAINLLNGLIDFKERILKNVLSCQLFAGNYPMLIEHIIREAKLYRTYLIELESGKDTELDDMRQVELFWDEIMMEHALFIRGLLDPSENNLINTADTFAKEYKLLLEETKNMTNLTMESIRNKSIQETIKIKEFKTAGAKGLESCQIKSIMLPLLGDHVLREANHYLRILRGESNKNK